MISLSPVATFKVEVGEPITIGETREGLRRVIPILGGTVSGPKLSGKILNAGADYQVIGADGYTTLDARYTAELDDGAMIYIVNVGVRYGSKEVMDRITRGEPVDPAEVYFRTTPSFETSAPDYQWLTRPLFIATAARHPDRVDIDVFEVA